MQCYCRPVNQLHPCSYRCRRGFQHLWFLSGSAAREGQCALVHTMHGEPSFPLPDVTAHSDEQGSHSAPCLRRFSVVLL